MKRFLSGAVLSLVLASSANAAIEIEETQDFGPTYGRTVADVTVGKPLQVAGAVLGTALHVVALPFSLASNSVDETYDTLVRQPWNALKRCNGCSAGYDEYIKTQQNPKTEVRFAVHGPSEVVILNEGEVRFYGNANTPIDTSVQLQHYQEPTWSNPHHEPF